jgi:hypothetical protein
MLLQIRLIRAGEDDYFIVGYQRAMRGMKFWKRSDTLTFEGRFRRVEKKRRVIQTPIRLRVGRVKAF